MQLFDWYKKVLTHYADFSGRARRSEYWYFVLCNFLISLVVSAVSYWVLNNSWLESLYGLAILIPSIAVGVRRLHDIGKSGWFWLVALIPLIGWIWVIILFCQDSQPGANKWGENPKIA